jgi:spermidine synthase
MLVLDGVVNLTEGDEYIYHEMIAHVPIFYGGIGTKKVLIIGGGDGGTAREVLRHDCIESVDMVEIDQKVIDICKEYFPSTANTLKDSDKRLNVMIDDGI